MKNKFYYLVFFLCALTLGLTSCEKEDVAGGKSSDIVGYWMPVSEEWEIYINGKLYEEGSEDYEEEVGGIRFDKDGDFYYWTEYDGDLLTEYGGTYNYKDGKLKMVVEYDEGDEYEDDYEDLTYTVKTLTSSKMVWEERYSYEEDGISCEAVARLNLKKVDVDD